VLAIDGLYAPGEGDAAPRFHRLPALSELDVVELEQAMVAKIVALCHRRGWVVEGAEAGGEGPLYEAAGAASIAGRGAFGVRRGRPVRWLGALPEFLLDEDEGEVSRLRPQGFSLFASPAVSGTDRSRVERSSGTWRAQRSAWSGSHGARMGSTRMSCGRRDVAALRPAPAHGHAPRLLPPAVDRDSAQAYFGCHEDHRGYS